MPRRQRSAWGSITKRRPGVYLVRWMGDAGDGRGYRRLSKTIRGTRVDARALLSRMQVEHADDRPVPTVREVFERWYWPDCEKRLKKQSLRQYKSTWKRIAERWGDLPVTDVRPLAVQEWLSCMTKCQAEGVMSVMKPLMDYPVRYELMPSNPLRAKYIMPTEYEKQDDGIYSLPELDRIANGMRGSYIESAFILAAFGSARVGESLGAMTEKTEEATASNGMRCACVLVDTQMDNTGEIDESLKNQQSERWAVVPEPWSLRLLEIAAERRRAGLAFLADDGCGGCVTQASMQREWKRVLKSVGLPHHPFKNTRPSWRTYMSWTFHAEPERLEKLMGHKGTSVTDRHYNRPLKQMLVDEVAAVFGGAKVPYT